MDNGFKKELEELIKKKHLDVTCNSSSYLLTEYLVRCLENINSFVDGRDIEKFIKKQELDNKNNEDFKDRCG